MESHKHGEAFARAEQQYENMSPLEPDAYCECDECGEEIYGGDEVYRFKDGKIIHKSCLIDWLCQWEWTVGEGLYDDYNEPDAHDEYGFRL